MDTPFADYTYYTDTFLGVSIPSTEFERLALRASEEVEALTFNRASVVIDANTDTANISAIKKATCAIAELLYDIEINGSEQGAIQSEKVGNHSVTYVAGGTASDADNIKSTALRYLGLTGLMYKGFF